MTWKMSYILIRLIFKSDTVEEQNDKAVSDQIANIAIFGFCVRKGRNSGGASIFFPIKVKIDNISLLQ